MASSIDSGNSGGKALKNSRIRRILCDFRLIGVVVGVLFWLFESSIHVSLLSEETYFQQITAPEPNELWMRSLVVVMLIGAGFYIQLTLKRIEEYKNSRLGSIQGNIRRYMVGLVILWTLIIGVSLTWDIILQHDNARKAAKVEGQKAFNKDLVYRKWVSSHGGVYVPVNEKTPPNPYLSHLQHRDVTTTEGKKLTLVNPAYMTRQVHELGKDQYGTRGHITSLKPLRPENGPDQWEEKALKAFEGGAAELNEFALIDGVKYMRTMRPMFVEESCLGCHNQQGYKVGDVCGGISVSVPMEPYMAIIGAYAIPLVLGHGLIWLIGVSGISYGSKQLGQELMHRKQAEEKSYETERRMSEMLANVQLCTVMFDSEGAITYVNDFLLKTTGYGREEIIGGNWFDIFIPAELREEIRGIHKELLSGNLKMAGRYENEIVTKDGQKRLISWSNTLFRYSTVGDIVGSTSIGEDITEHRLVETKIHDQKIFLEQIIESLSHPFYVLDANDHTITLSNTATGRYGEVTEGMTCYALSHNKDEPCSGLEHRCTLEEVKRTGKPVVLEHIHFDKEGAKQFVEVHGHPIFDSNGNVTQLIEYCFDITKRKQAENTLQAKTHDLSERIKELNCLYGLSKLIDEYDSIEAVFSGLVKIMPSVWRYPEVTCCRVTALGGEYKSNGFEQTEWMQRSEIIVNNEVSGSIEVFYKQQCPSEYEGPFLKEERDLIDALSERLGRMVEYKQAAEALQESEERYRAIAEDMPVLICRFLPGSEITYVNEAYCRYFGKTAEELVGHAFLSLILEADRETMMANISALTVESPTDSHEYRVIASDGEIRWQRWTNRAMFDAQGKAVAYQSIGEDITEHKEAEEKLRLQSEITKNMTEGVYLIGLEDLRIIYANPEFEKMFGYNSGEMNGKHVSIVNATNEKASGETAKEIVEVLNEAGQWQGEIENIKKDGTPFWCHANVSVFDHPEHGKVIVSVHTDINERKQAEEQVEARTSELVTANRHLNASNQELKANEQQLRTTYQELEKEKGRLAKAQEKQHELELAHAARLSSMGEMASGLAHEINQPLCAITSFADASVRMLESKRFRSRDVLKSMESVSTQARRAGEIIKNMRAFVSKDPASFSEIDIREVIRDSVNLVRGQISQRQAKVELELPDESLTATANRVQIEQVIINLIQNSLDAMDQTDIGGREILIEACETDEDKILVSVVDSGKGLGDVNPSQMFDPFFTTKEEGMGIGLSINSSIIEEHGGKLWAETNESGATFKFTIPINGKEES